MALFDLIEIADLFTSWRLYVGVAITGAIVFGLLALIPAGAPDWVSWTVCGPIALVGIGLSFRWQVRADDPK